MLNILMVILDILSVANDGVGLYPMFVISI